MNKQKSLIIFLSILSVILLLVTAILGSQILKEGEVKDPGNNNVEEENIEIDYDFETNLFKEGYSDSKKEGIPNTVISPLSIKMALAMVAEGAKEDTLTELKNVLKLDENSKEYYKGYLEDVLKQKDIIFKIANSLWSREELEFEQEFIDILGTYYQAEARSIDFKDPSSVDVINNWVEDKTEGKIKKLLSEIKDSDIMFLINAIYFNADWKEQFKEEATQMKDFTLADGSKIKTNLMAQNSDFQYLEDEEIQAVQLPYGDAGRYVMRVYLPKEGKSIDSIVNSLTNEKLVEWGNTFSEKEGHLELPKFKIEYSKSLKEILNRLGIEKAFDATLANFDGIRKESYINEVIHKTYIDVSERGTEAAAVTAIEISMLSAPSQPVEKFEMIVNRPFFFTIDDSKSNEILFMGSILDPRK